MRFSRVRYYQSLVPFSQQLQHEFCRKANDRDRVRKSQLTLYERVSLGWYTKNVFEDKIYVLLIETVRLSVIIVCPYTVRVFNTCVTRAIYFCFQIPGWIWVHRLEVVSLHVVINWMSHFSLRISSKNLQVDQAKYLGWSWSLFLPPLH